jgi:hypothetical protein
MYGQGRTMQNAGAYQSTFWWCTAVATLVGAVIILNGVWNLHVGRTFFEFLLW